jgi:hypothetical protein
MTKPSRRITVIERIEIVDHCDNRSSVFTGLREKGYRVTHSGPYTNKKMWPEVDPDWFMLTAERKLESNKSETQQELKGTGPCGNYSA